MSKRLKMAVTVWAFLWGCMIMACFGDSIPLSLHNYEKVEFNLNNDDYNDFINKVRDQLKSGMQSHGIPLLNTNLQQSQRYLLIEVTSLSTRSVTLAIDRIDVYVVGYLGSNGNSFFFSDKFKEAKDHLFTTSTTKTQLPYTGDYQALGSIAGAGRSETLLGFNQLDQAIMDLFKAKPKENYKLQAKAFIVTIQMISEAARFGEIETRVANSISSYEPFKPDKFMMELENSWSKLSIDVQNAEAAQGNLTPIIKVAGNEYKTVSAIQELISLLLPKRKTNINDENPIGGHASHFLKIIRPVVSGRDIEYSVTWDPSVTIINIVGYHDLCLQAIGASVRLKECNRHIEEQKWALYGDRTIRPNWDPRSCLTPTYDSEIERSIITINNCIGLLGQRWLITEAGMILNQITQTVMEVRGADINDHQILLRKPNGSPGQFWVLAF